MTTAPHNSHFSKRFPDPPSTAQQLDQMIAHIDAGDSDLASLSDEQREQLKADLCAAWLDDYLDDYPVPTDIAAATDEYLAIESGTRYPHLPDNVHDDLLMHFDEHFGEGGPAHWMTRNG